MKKLELNHYQGSKALIVISLISLLGVASLGIALALHNDLGEIPLIGLMWLMIWLGLAIFFTIISLKEFAFGYLCSVFCFMIAWRIASISHLNLISDLMCFSFLFIVANFIYCCWVNLHKRAGFLHQLSIVEWQIVFVRLYIGFDFVPHFTEKLFAGSDSHYHVVQAFIHLGIPHPDLFVWLAGLCEFISTISIGLGLFIRPGAIFCGFYLLIATYLGHHFSLGFMWVMPGGGWEFALLWAMLVFSFAVSGAHSFSLDQYLEDEFNLPLFLRRCL